MTDKKEAIAEKFDVNSLTLGEVDQIETLSGFAIDLLKDKNTPKGKLLAAIAFVIKHRQNPKFTFPMALTLPMSEVLDLIGDDEDDEKPAGAADPEA